MSTTRTEEKIEVVPITSPSAGGGRGDRHLSVLPPNYCPPSSPGPHLGRDSAAARAAGQQSHIPAVPQPVGGTRQEDIDLGREVESYFRRDQAPHGLGGPGLQLLGTEVINLCNDLAVLETYVGGDIVLTGKFINLLSPSFTIMLSH